MRKTGIIFLIQLLLITCSVSNAQRFEVRATNKGFGIIGVEIRQVAGTPATTTDYVTDMVFGLKWKTSYNVDLAAAIATTYNVKKSGLRQVKDSFNFQAFYADKIPFLFTQTLVKNQWIEIMNIANSQTGTGTGNFEICDKDFSISTDLNAGINLFDNSPSINGKATGVLLSTNLLDVTATAEKASIFLQWKTNNKIIKGYEIQRSETENGIFSTIARVDADINNISNIYDFDDSKVQFNKDYFYRIKQVDAEGKEFISSCLKSKIISDNGFKLYPNPTKDVLFLSIPSKYRTKKFKIRINDIKGYTVYDQKDINDNNSVIQIDLSKLPMASYILTIEDNDEIVFSSTLIKM